MMNTLTQMPEVVALLQGSDRPLLLAHPRPDGDAIGSVLALRLALLQLGKSPLVACIHPAPDTFAYLPGHAEFVQTLPPDAGIDLVVAVDQSDLRRTGGLYPESWRGVIPLAVIDHHETNDAFGDANLVVGDAAATAVVMTDVIAALGVPLTPDIATCLLTGILGDTRGLRTDNTTPDVLALVTHLMAAGGDYHTAMREGLDVVPYIHMRAWGIALNNLRLEDGLAWTTLNLEDKAALDIADHEDIDLGNLINHTREARVIAVFIEMRDGTVKVSLRSRGSVNVAGVAKMFAGGGHQQAAGFSVAGPLDVATATALPPVRALLSGF